MRRKKLTFLLCILAAVLWTGFIFARSLRPADLSSRESGWLLHLLRRQLPDLPMLAVRKGAHVLEYLILALLIGTGAAACRGRAGSLPLLPSLAVAISDELIQTMVPGRSGQLTDILLDCGGAGAACLFLAGVFWLRNKGRRHSL